MSPWWPETTWRAMRAGVDCPMCADAHLPSNPFGILVTELPATYVRLHRNQTRPGYCVVIAKEHVPEVHEFDDETLVAFWRDAADVGRAIEQVFSPVKLDSLIMGHRCPHVHCHLYPLYPSDDPYKPVDIGEGDRFLSDDELLPHAQRLAAQLGG